MNLEPHADGKGFMLTIPRNKYFVADADPLPGLSGKMRSIHEQRTGDPVARLYEAETIDLTTLSEWWTIAVEPAFLNAPSPPGKKPNISGWCESRRTNSFLSVRIPSATADSAAYGYTPHILCCTANHL